MTREEIEREVGKFARWHYQIDLGGVLTPVFKAENINRHSQRKSYFFEPLVRCLGGSLRGKRVLDLGCNAGFWSLAAAEAGCDYVCGLDARSMHIEQANLVFRARNIPANRYRFIQGSVYDDLSQLGPFDVVLFLGLLYHVNRPVELMDSISRVNTDVLVIDTALHVSDSPVFYIQSEDVADPRNSFGSQLVLVPSQKAVIDVARAFGYTGVVLRPRFSDYTGCDDFRDGYRRAFVCSRQSNLECLREAAEQMF